jgi:hypothetical protein
MPKRAPTTQPSEAGSEDGLGCRRCGISTTGGQAKLQSGSRLEGRSRCRIGTIPSTSPAPCVARPRCAKPFRCTSPVAHRGHSRILAKQRSDDLPRRLLSLVRSERSPGPDRTPPSGRKQKRARAGVGRARRREASVRLVEHPEGEAVVRALVRDALVAESGAQNGAKSGTAMPSNHESGSEWTHLLVAISRWRPTWGHRPASVRTRYSSRVAG